MRPEVKEPRRGSIKNHYLLLFNPEGVVGYYLKIFYSNLIPSGLATPKRRY